MFTLRVICQWLAAPAVVVMERLVSNRLGSVFPRIPISRRPVLTGVWFASF